MPGSGLDTLSRANRKNEIKYPEIQMREYIILFALFPMLRIIFL